MSIKLFPVTLAASLLGSTAIADVPSVAVDIAPIHSLVARVMQGTGTPDLVIPPGASPHEYNLKPSEAQALQNADLVFWVGEDLTPWLEDAIDTLATGAAVTALLETDGTELLDFRESALFEAHDHDDHGDDHDEDDHDDHGHDDDHSEKEDDDHDHDEHAEDDHDEHDHDEHAEGDKDEHDHDEHAEEDHDEHDHDEHAEAKHDDHDDHAEDGHEGHDHGEHDPHAWLSTENAGNWLNIIAAQLSAADPENAGAYFANAAAGREELASLKAEISATLDAVRGNDFVVFHDAYQYFERSFDFPASGAISLSDATDPSPARIAEIQERVREDGIECVLSEPQYNPGMVATVMDGTQAQTGVLDPLGSGLEPGAGLYPQLLRNLAKTLSDCLS